SVEFKEKVRSFNVDMVEVDEPIEIKENVFTTGEIIGSYANSSLPEQALVVKEDKLTIITGCAHPGIITMLKRVKEIFPYPIGLVLGGFHLYDKSDDEIYLIVEEFKSLNIERVAPCHCTGERAVKLFQQEFGNSVIKVSTGTILLED
ncbi:MAG: MBL fold metallo-hydrolase, partial [bacterium]